MPNKTGFGQFFALKVAVVTALVSVSAQVTANDQEQYVPADALFYFGTGRSIPADHMFAIVPKFDLPPEVAGSDKNAEAFKQYMSLFENTSENMAKWGIDDQIQVSMYTVGLQPVLRLSLKDPEKFDSALSALEKEKDITPVSSKRGDVSIRFYPSNEMSELAGQYKDEDGAEGAANDPDVEQSEAAEQVDSKKGLLVANDGKDLIVSAIFTDIADEKLIESLVGINKPSKSIVDSGKLKELRKKWAYGDEFAGFIDIEQIATTLTDSESATSKELAALLSEPQAQAMLGMMRSEPCRAEVSALAGSWPMIVTGLRKFDVSDKEVVSDSHMAVVVKHELLRDTLRLLRGVVPTSQSSGQAMVSVGLGITVDRLAQAVGQFSQLLAGVKYECPLLANLNGMASADLSAASMGVVMFGGLARGVQGMAFNVFDVDADVSSPQDPVKNIDTAIAISAADPALLVQTLKMMPQLGMLAELPLDGTEMSLNEMLPVPVPENIQIKAAVKGKNIVIYSGEKGTDYANRLGGSDVEGFYQVAVDTGQLIDKATTVMESSGKSSENTEFLLEFLKAYPRGNLNYMLDFTEEGIELTSGVRFERPAK